MTAEPEAKAAWWRRAAWPALEIIAVVAIFAIYGGGPVPHVNEAHYLCKAKHFWDPSWCANDLFLSSAEAHWVFYIAIGWPTKWLTLTQTAWLGRFVGWILLAISWVHFSRTIQPTRGWSVMSGTVFAFLVAYTPMSGEWVLGGIEGKVIAYALVLCGMAAMVQNRWKSVWPALGLAATFHVLVGGWAVVAAMLGWLVAGPDRMKLKPMLPYLVIGFVISLAGLVPALMLSSGVDPKLLSKANQIYVMERLPHHLVYSSFVPRQVALHFITMFVAVVTAIVMFPTQRLRPLLGFGVAAIVVAWIGIGINQWTLSKEDNELAASLLRFYWFRMSDACLPMMLAVVVPLAWMKLFRQSKQAAWIGSLLLLAVVGFDVSQRIAFLTTNPPPSADRQSLAWSRGDHEEKRELHQQWKETCAWIRKYTEADATVLTPRNQQTFKWYAQRAEVVNWKDVPQDAKTLTEWWARLNDIYGYVILGPLNLTDEALADLIETYDVDYMIVPRSDVQMREKLQFPLKYPRVYPYPDKENAYYIYDVRTR